MGTLKSSEEKKLEYLGMDLDYSTPGKVKFLMVPYIIQIIKDFPEEIAGKAATPAADYLFEVNSMPNKRLLPEEQAIHLHHYVAKLLFISGQAHQDIQTPVAFLATCIKKWDDDDWEKLQRVVKYLSGTKSLCLTLIATDIGMIKWYVDASYAIHNDCQGHIGAILTFRSGAVTSFSQKQKMNAKSSAKAKLIGVNDAIPQILWTCYFLEHQGYHIISNTIF